MHARATWDGEAVGRRSAPPFPMAQQAERQNTNRPTRAVS